MGLTRCYKTEVFLHLLLLITNMKSHAGFCFVPIPMTLNVTVLEDRPIISVKYCLPVPLPVFYFWRKL